MHTFIILTLGALVTAIPASNVPGDTTAVVNAKAVMSRARGPDSSVKKRGLKDDVDVDVWLSSDFYNPKGVDLDDDDLNFDPLSYCRKRGIDDLPRCWDTLRKLRKRGGKDWDDVDLEGFDFGLDSLPDGPNLDWDPTLDDPELFYCRKRGLGDPKCKRKLSKRKPGLKEDDWVDFHYDPKAENLDDYDPKLDPLLDDVNLDWDSLSDDPDLLNSPYCRKRGLGKCRRNLSKRDRKVEGHDKLTRKTTLKV